MTPALGSDPLIARLGGLDLSPILVYRIPSLVDSAVLPMAWQWDVLNPLLLPELSQIVTLAFPGWDPVTGWGTPKGNKFVAALKAMP